MNTVYTLPDNDAQLFKEGSGIRIKEYDRGKFTESAKSSGIRMAVLLIGIRYLKFSNGGLTLVRQTMSVV